MTANRTMERAVLAGVFVYIGLTLAVSAYLAYAPDDASLRGLFRLSPCAMRVRLGIPCPLCFGTRTYILIWQGHWAMALQMNPLAFALFWLSVAGLLAVIWLALSRLPVQYWIGRVSRRTWVVAVIAFCACLLANWIYLILVQARATGPSAMLRL